MRTTVTLPGERTDEDVWERPVVGDVVEDGSRVLVVLGRNELEVTCWEKWNASPGEVVVGGLIGWRALRNGGRVVIRGA